MKLSLIIPVLNSHEIVRRQVLHFASMPLPSDAELILVDDGSDPPIPDSGYEWLKIVRTGDFRNWTQPKARNIGASHATGDYLLFTDIDHIVTLPAIEFGRACRYGYAKFRRELGLLDEEGRFTQDRTLLGEYGISSDRGLRVSCHTLSMIVQADAFRKTGGFREKYGSHPTHDDGNMKKKLKALERTDGLTKCPDGERPTIYVIPNGRFCGDKDTNPFGLFHNLPRHQEAEVAVA